MPSWLQTFSVRVVDPLLTLLVVAIKALWEEHRLRVLSLGVMLLGSLLLANQYIGRTKQYQSIVSSTVNSAGEDTPQRYKVLEAFTMASLDTSLRTQIASARLSPDFVNRLNALDAILAAPSSVADAATPLGAMLSLPSYKTRTQSAQDAIITDNAKDGFLFFPLKLLRTKLDPTEYSRVASEATGTGSATVDRWIQSDPTIADDFRASRRLLPAMRLFQVPVITRDPTLDAGDYGVEITPAQIYYITKNGVNRIVNADTAPAQQLVYKNMFRSTTFFPSRPYYVAAFKNWSGGTLRNLSGRVDSSFYVSQPYLDIGGFGAVITIARPLSYRGHSDGLIAFDLPVMGLMANLGAKLTAFNSAPDTATCLIDFNATAQCSVRSNRRESRLMREALRDTLRAAMGSGDLSTIVGNISTLGSSATRNGNRGPAKAEITDLITYPYELITGSKTRPISFAVPLSAPKATETRNGLKAEFLLVSLNLDRYQQITALYGFASVALAAMVFVGALLSLHGEMRRRQSFEDAFQTIEQVLYGAPTPYMRLDSEDKVVNCNTAFCEMIKMPADANSVSLIKSRTLESLISQKSKGTYRHVQDRRRARQEVQPYTLIFDRGDGTEVEARVISNVTPKRSTGGMPETFGIIVPADGLRPGPGSEGIGRSESPLPRR